MHQQLFIWIIPDWHVHSHCKHKSMYCLWSRDVPGCNWIANSVQDVCEQLCIWLICEWIVHFHNHALLQWMWCWLLSRCERESDCL